MTSQKTAAEETMLTAISLNPGISMPLESPVATQKRTSSSDATEGENWTDSLQIDLKYLGLYFYY